MEQRPIHLVVRFSDNLFGVGDVVAKHNAIVEKRGYVWFGKIGTTISNSRMNDLNSQIKNGMPTYLYLVKGNRKKSAFYRAHLLLITRELPRGESKAIPPYYSTKALRQHMNAWMQVSQIVPADPSSMKNLQAISSVFPIQETLVRSSSGYFLVHEAKDIF
jgi:hypothetical protein